jgi:3-dehydroquinate synthase
MKLKVNLKKEIDDSYDIVIESGLFDEIPIDIKKNFPASKYAIITDSRVKNLYGRKLLEIFKRNDLDTELIEFPEGEESKNWNTVQIISRSLAKSGFDRNSIIVALGGGVTGDLAGFVASIYMRGIRYIHIPTTLLSQVDSSVGGKTGTNIPEGKNLIGNFHQPKKVYIDPELLRTLSIKELKNGLAEVIKYGTIYDEKFFEYLEQHVDDVLKLDKEVLSEIIFRCCKIKSEIVEKDEKEKNLRSILNYGHTFGHVVEALTDYKKYTHGEAVAIGMNFAGKLAVGKKLWSEKELKRQNQLIKKFGLAIKIPKFEPVKIIEIMKSDKKT